MTRLAIWITIAFAALSSPHAQAQQAEFHVLAFYSEKVEHDHVDFAHQATKFYSNLSHQKHFEFVTTTDWDDLNPANLSKYQVVVWLDDFPHTAAQRAAFEQYMTHGGGWLGFHVTAYNDSGTHWPWFVDFLGGGVFYGNNWPPLPATLLVDDKTNPATKRLPAKFISPANEWYSWKPSPRLNNDVKVLLTLSPENYPIGFKDVLTGGDVPVVWTNTRYRMTYMNMGHGNHIFDSETQNHLFEDALESLGLARSKASQ